MHSEAEVAPGAAVVPPPQLAQDEPSLKYPTSQMHSEAEVAPGSTVVPWPQLTQVDVEKLSLYVSAGQMSQLPFVAPSTRVQPLPSPQESSQWTTQALNPVQNPKLAPSELQEMISPADTDKPVGATTPLCSIPPIVNLSYPASV